MAIRDQKQRVRVRIHAREELSPIRKYIRWFFQVVCLGIFVLLVWYITRMPQVTVTDILIKGGVTVSHDDIRLAVEGVLDETYFTLIPKRFTFFIPEEDLVSAVARVPRTHSVSVTRDGLTSLKVTFAEYMPDALWCEDQKEQKCMYIDEEGRAFTVAPDLNGGALVRYRSEGVGEIKEGDTLDTSLIKTFKTLRTRMNEELKLRVSQIILKRNGDIELHCNGGGMILVSSTKDVQSTFEDLATVLASKEFTHLASGNFKYIDLRFERKVFINEEIGTTTNILDENATST